MILVQLSAGYPDLEIRGGGQSSRPLDKGGPRLPKKFFGPFWPQFGLDPPLHLHLNLLLVLVYVTIWSHSYPPEPRPMCHHMKRRHQFERLRKL